MVIAEIVTLLLYAGSIVFLTEYFGMCFYLRHVVATSEHRVLQRSFICNICAICLEGGRHCGGQRFPVVCDQAYKGQDLSCCFK